MANFILYIAFALLLIADVFILLKLADILGLYSFYRYEMRDRCLAKDVIITHTWRLTALITGLIAITGAIFEGIIMITNF